LRLAQRRRRVCLGEFEIQNMSSFIIFQNFKNMIIFFTISPVAGDTPERENQSHPRIENRPVSPRKPARPGSSGLLKLVCLNSIFEKVYINKVQS
jgi:hypothetical protein